MKHVWNPACRLLLGLTIALSLSATVAHAQVNRTTMVDSAQALIDEFNERQSIGLLRMALNPALGAPDLPWARAVQLLGQTLLQTNQREEALAWFRWALRQSPSLQVDSVIFTPAVVSAFNEARAFVAASRKEPRASVQFLWTTSTTSGGLGDLIVARAAARTATPVQFSVNDASLAEKQPRRLPPGSYRVTARVAGETDAECTTEVLPGVTTIVTMSFVSEQRVVAEATAAPAVPGDDARPTAPPTAAAEKPPASKRRSRLLPIMGGVTLAGLAAVLAMPKGPDPVPTGGIVILLP